MPYTKITRARRGREALGYALVGMGHNGAEKRNLYVTSVGMLPPDVMSYRRQMQYYWDKADARNKTQVNRIIASFSPNELDPKNQLHAQIAARIAQEFVRDAYPDRQAVICVQNDGKGGKLHMHILVNNVSITDHKGCTGAQLISDYVKDHFNAAAKRYITLDEKSKLSEKEKNKTQDRITQNERRLRDQNERLPEAGRKYIWKDDLKARVRKAMDAAADREGFLKQLMANGVKGTYRKATKKQDPYILYELTDTSGFEEGATPGNKLRAKSYKLGTDYGLEELDRQIAERADKAAGQGEPKAPVDTQAAKPDMTPGTFPASCAGAPSHAWDTYAPPPAPARTGEKPAHLSESKTLKAGPAGRTHRDAPAPGPDMQAAYQQRAAVLKKDAAAAAPKKQTIGGHTFYGSAADYIVQYMDAMQGSDAEDEQDLGY